jgi:hypothetical protein
LLGVILSDEVKKAGSEHSMAQAMPSIQRAGAPGLADADAAKRFRALESIATQLMEINTKLETILSNLREPK